MRIRSAFVLLAAAVGTLPAFADTYYVSATYGNDDTGDGSAATPYATIAKGYEAAANAGDEVVVSNDTYTLTAGISIARGVTIRGLTGKPEDVIVKYGGSTSGDGFRMFTLSHADAKLAGLVVANGYFNGWAAKGGGVQIASAGGTVSNCVVRGCRLGGNYCAGGGGVAVCSSAGLVTHCVISNCWDGGSKDGNWPAGGAILIANGNVRNCLILKNTYEATKATSYGVVRIDNGAMDNCTIADNVAGKRCSGVWATGGTVRNCIIAGNRTMSVENPTNAVWAGTASCFTDCVSDVAPINANCHCLVEPYAGHYAGDYRPAPGTVSVNGGATRPWMTGATDFEGNDRIRGTAPDIGCYEIDPNAYTATVSLASGAYGFANERIGVTVFVSSVGAKGVKCEWDWDGDGTYDETTYGTSTSHVFTAFGTHKVSARVTDLSSENTCVTPVVSFPVHPRQVYVSKTSTPESPYGTKGTAANDLPTAYASAVEGAEVVFVTDAEPYPITAQLDVTKAVTIRSETHRPEDAVLSCSGSHRFVQLDNAAARIAGLAISGFCCDGFGYLGGAVVFVSHGGIVSNCVFRNCKSGSDWTRGGAAIGIDAGAADSLVTHCVISNCVERGRSEAPASTSTSCGGGSAIAMYAGTVRNCLMIGNYRACVAAGAGCYYGTVRVAGGTLENCTIADNTAGDRCAGVWAYGGTVRNCIIAGNTTTSTDHPEYAVWAGTASCFADCVTDVAAINENCHYLEDPYAGHAIGDYRPAPGSVSVNGASLQAWMTGATDIEGNDRIRGDAPDVGCYEIDPYSFTATFKMSSGAYGFAQETITATVSPSVIGELGTKCEWDWDGDGVYEETTYGTTATHVFTEHRTHAVSARVTDLSSELSCLTSVLSFPVYPRQIYVSKTGSGTPPYATPATGTNDLYAAYASAVDGTEIVFVSDTYTITNQFDVVKAVTIRSDTGRPEDVILASDGQYHRLFSLNNVSARLAGLTLTGAKLNYFYCLGGALTFSSNGGVVSNCVFRNCRVENNWTMGGGAIVIPTGTANALVTHCVISNCAEAGHSEAPTGEGSAAGGGSAIAMYAGTVRNCLFTRNYRASLMFAGECLYGTVRISGGTLENCTFADNTADDRCAGVWAYGGTVVNCLIASNRTTSATHPEYAAWAGTASCFDHCVTDVAAINELCAFAPRAFKHYDRGDYHSAQASPAVNGGMLRPWMDGATDLDGKPRIQASPDVGCYERDRHGLAVICR